VHMNFCKMCAQPFRISGMFPFVGNMLLEFVWRRWHLIVLGWWPLWCRTSLFLCYASRHLISGQTLKFNWWLIPETAQLGQVEWFYFQMKWACKLRSQQRILLDKNCVMSVQDTPLSGQASGTDACRDRSLFFWWERLRAHVKVWVIRLFNFEK
jgi:hypothetical protein